MTAGESAMARDCTTEEERLTELEWEVEVEWARHSELFKAEDDASIKVSDITAQIEGVDSDIEGSTAARDAIQSSIDQMETANEPNRRRHDEFSNGVVDLRLDKERFETERAGAETDEERARIDGKIGAT